MKCRGGSPPRVSLIGEGGGTPTTFTVIMEQDNAPCHVSIESQEIYDKFKNKLKFWPPNSPGKY